MKKLYIAGPMTGYEDYNFPAFFAAEKQFTDAGWVVFNPARNDLERYGEDFLEHPERFDVRATMEDDTRWICRHADAILLLPGWEKSSGVAVEVSLARYLKLEIIEL